VKIISSAVVVDEGVDVSSSIVEAGVAAAVSSTPWLAALEEAGVSVEEDAGARALSRVSTPSSRNRPLR